MKNNIYIANNAVALLLQSLMHMPLS